MHTLILYSLWNVPTGKHDPLPEDECLAARRVQVTHNSWDRDTTKPPLINRLKVRVVGLGYAGFPEGHLRYPKVWTAHLHHASKHLYSRQLTRQLFPNIVLFRVRSAMDSTQTDDSQQKDV